MKYLTVLFITLGCFVSVLPALGTDCTSARTSKEWDAIADAWREEAGDFIFQVWSIAQGDQPTEEREKQYNVCAKKLASKARELKIGTESLLPLVQACITEQEANRMPPPGWNPDDAKGNLARFSETSSRMVQLHLQLLAYGRKHCK